VRHIYNNDKRPPKEHYLQAIYTAPDDEGGDPIDVIVTMLSGLAEFIHDASVTEHDTTFKRVHGKFK